MLPLPSDFLPIVSWDLKRADQQVVIARRPFVTERVPPHSCGNATVSAYVLKYICNAIRLPGGAYQITDQQTNDENRNAAAEHSAE